MDPMGTVILSFQISIHLKIHIMASRNWYRSNLKPTPKLLFVAFQIFHESHWISFVKATIKGGISHGQTQMPRVNDMILYGSMILMLVYYLRGRSSTNHWVVFYPSLEKAHIPSYGGYYHSYAHNPNCTPKPNGRGVQRAPLRELNPPRRLEWYTSVDQRPRNLSLDSEFSFEWWFNGC